MQDHCRFLCAAILGFTIGMAHGQQKGTPYDVRGTVINSQTGRPLARVLVIIQSPEPRIALTDASGQFVFEGLRNEPAQIRIGKPGFLDARDISPGSSTGQIEVNSRTESLIIKLSPASVIHGRIAAAQGTPLEGVPVDLFYSGPIDGEERLIKRASATTDQDGFFTFNDLTAGRYFISAGPFLEKPLLPVEHSGILLENYGFVFYPGVSDSHEATPIQLGFGQDLPLELSLPRVRLFTVRGQVEGWHAGDYGALRLMSSGTESNYDPLMSSGTGFNYDPQFDSATGSFYISHVPAGTYTVHFFTATADGREAEQELNVDGNVSNVRISPSPPRGIPLVLHATDPRAEHGFVNVMLKPEDKWQQTVATSLRSANGQETPFLHQPPPGRYRVHFGTAPPLYVAAASCGSTDLLREPLVVTKQNTTPIELTLAYDSATLSGEVRGRNLPPSMHVLIVPIDPPGEARSVLTSVTGKFGALSLSPGTYRVWAFERLPRYFREAEKMELYSSRAQVVTLTANQTAVVQLEMLKAEESDE